MNGVMNKNQLIAVKKYEYIKLLFRKNDFIIDISYRDCHNIYFRSFEYLYVYDIKLTNNRKTDLFNLTISDRSIKLYELKEKLKIARQNVFIFIQTNKFSIKSYGILSQVNIHYYLNLLIPIMHRHFYRILSQNPDYEKLVVLIEITLFILHVVDGIYILTHNIDLV